MAIFSSRDGSLDFIRICAILAVLVIHSIATIVLQSPIGSKRWMIGNVIDSFMRWSVPVFVMLSGMLVIKPKTFSKRDDFLKRKLTRILVPLIIWPLIYVAWSALFFNMTPHIRPIIDGYISGSPAPGHLYFLFLIAGLYLLAPAISLYADSVNKRQFLTATIVVLAFTAAWHIITTLIPGQEAGQRLSAITQGLPYIGYFMLGYALKDVRPKRTWVPFATFIISGLAISVVSYYMTTAYGLSKGLTFYAFPSLLAMAIAVSAYFVGRIIYERIMSLLSKRMAKKTNSVLQTLSEATFGVYLIHLIFMYSIAKVFNLNFMSITQTFVIFISTVFLSYAASIILMRLPYVRILVK